MSIPGMIYPTQKGLLAGNPRDSAISQMNQMNAKQATLSSSVGGRRRNKKYGGDGKIAVPQYQMLYTSQSGPGTDPNAQIQNNLKTSTQSSANAVYDQYAYQKGGHKKKTLKKRRRQNQHKRKRSRSSRK